VQQLCEVKVQTYLAADNPFDVVSQPEVCGGCAGRDCFHRHGTYERYVEEMLRKVARFLCLLCHKTTSVLPAFVLPYRATLVKDVDDYFLADESERPHKSRADMLRRYWREWCAHWPTLQRQSGWPPVRPLAREPQAYWQQLRRAAGSIAGAQVRLIGRYGLSLLRRYACHRAVSSA